MVGDDSCEPAPTGTRDGGHPFSFPKIRSLYPSNLGQATPSALGHFRLAVTVRECEPTSVELMIRKAE
jgi:hypothetical protein